VLSVDKTAEDMVIELARQLYRDWEARPWHVKLKGRIREMRERIRIARKGW
jgi:hypothetical protein